ncbi:MAG: hypothetical protein ACRD1K_13205 [Acidimicrobiales bacterium]
MSFVRFVVGPTGPRCEAVGTRHRQTVTRSIPLRAAMSLVAAGVPSVVRRTAPVTGQVTGQLAGARA